MYLGDDQSCDVIDKGEMQIKLNEFVWNMKNVKHVPNLRKNLFSIRQLAKYGYVRTFVGDKWKILRSDDSCL